MADGVTTRAEMTARLQEDHNADVSEATVGRYMAKIRQSAGTEAFAKIQDHVNRVVPEDLAALEEMEKQALDWSRQAGATSAERAAAAAENIAGELMQWREAIISARQDEAADKVVRWIIKRAAFLLAEDDRRQEQRIAAMRMVHKIIETKLAKAGLLDDDQKGRIVFLTRKATGQDEDGAPGQADGRRVLRLIGRSDDSDGS